MLAHRRPVVGGEHGSRGLALAEEPEGRGLRLENTEAELASVWAQDSERRRKRLGVGGELGHRDDGDDAGRRPSGAQVDQTRIALAADPERSIARKRDGDRLVAQKDRSDRLVLEGPERGLIGPAASLRSRADAPGDLAELHPEVEGASFRQGLGGTIDGPAADEMTKIEDGSG